MSKIQIWLMAIRAKTLLAGISPYLLAISLVIAYRVQQFPGLGLFHSSFTPLNLFLLLLLVVVGQISANLCNDYFDGKRGVDNQNRLGPIRVTQQQYLSDREMKIGICLSFLIPFLLGLYFAFKIHWALSIVVVVGLLISFLYTGGRFSLAYYGLGDIFAFLVFGPLFVNVIFFIFTKIFLNWVFVYSLLPGMFAVMLIGVNNYRDQENDKAYRKYTLAVLWGKVFCKWQYLFSALVVCWLPLWIALGVDYLDLTIPFGFNDYGLGITLAFFSFFFIPLLKILWQEKIELFNKF